MFVVILSLFSLNYPITKAETFKDTIFGVEISDPYRSLENFDNPEVKKWISEQNQLTLKTLKDIKGYKKIYREIEKASRNKFLSLPSVYGDYFFFTKYDGKSNFSVVYASKGKWDIKKGKKIIDPNKFSKDGTVSLDFWVPSLDGKYIAFGKSYGGSENSTLYILDVEKGEILNDSIPETKWTSIAWLPDNSGFYYTRNTGGEKYLPRVYLHKIGRNYNEDEYVFGEGLPETWMPSISRTRDGRFLVLYIEKGWSQNDLYVKEFGKEGDWIKIAENLDGTFYLQSYGDHFYIITNYKAPRYRILRVPISNPSIENAEEIVSESTYVIENFTFAGGKLIFRVMDSTFTRIFVANTEGKIEGEIPLPTKGSAYFSIENYESPKIYISFESFAYPPTIFEYDLNTRQLTKIWQMETDFIPEDYTTEFVLYPSKDGTKIPMYIIYKNGIKKDGQNPAILNGYGGFAVSMTPHFIGYQTTLLKRGFVYAVACIRGGGEFGEEWHRAGMRDKKQNVFDDFIKAAEYLIEKGYTNPEKLAIMGGSNGGLLVGAVLTQRPDLFRAVICSVPLLDMIRYHKFGVAHIWIPEYGNPDDLSDFKYLFEYSPYHRIDREKDRVFPSVFFHTAEFDGRVHPMHAMKMAAKMQNMVKTKGPILLYVEPKAGHGTGGSKKKRIENKAINTIYLFWQLGIKP